MMYCFLLFDVTENCENLQKFGKQIINLPMKLKAFFTRPESYRVADIT